MSDQTTLDSVRNTCYFSCCRLDVFHKFALLTKSNTGVYNSARVTTLLFAVDDVASHVGHKQNALTEQRYAKVNFVIVHNTKHIKL